MNIFRALNRMFLYVRSLIMNEQLIMDEECMICGEIHDPLVLFDDLDDTVYVKCPTTGEKIYLTAILDKEEK